MEKAASRAASRNFLDLAKPRRFCPSAIMFSFFSRGTSYLPPQGKAHPHQGVSGAHSWLQGNLRTQYTFRRKRRWASLRTHSWQAPCFVELLIGARFQHNAVQYIASIYVRHCYVCRTWSQEQLPTDLEPLYTQRPFV